MESYKSKIYKRSVLIYIVWNAEKSVCVGGGDSECFGGIEL